MLDLRKKKPVPPFSLRKPPALQSLNPVPLFSLRRKPPAPNFYLTDTLPQVTTKTKPLKPAVTEAEISQS